MYENLAILQDLEKCPILLRVLQATLYYGWHRGKSAQEG
jgi:hypothetical protein